MADPSSPASGLAEVAALAVALERDEQRSAAERRERDARLAEPVAAAGPSREAGARAWLDAICEEDATLRQRREQARAAAGWTSALTTLAGLLLGWLAAFAALYYDGSGRVNVVAVLAVFVFVPGLFLIPFFVAAMPRTLMRWLPGAEATAALCRGISPGRIALALQKWLPREWREAWERVSARAGSQQRVYARVQQWAILRWSQLFALGFQLAAVSAACWLVVFSDLAFGWSTTLTSGDHALDARRLHDLTSTLAAPWSWALPTADPSLELVRESRYFRAVSQPLSPEAAARLGGWWRFLVLCMVIYGLLPRVLTLVFASHRLRSAARAAFVATPGLTAVLGRLHRARVQTGAADPRREPGEDTAGTLPELATVPADHGFAAIVNWSSLPVEDALLAARFGGAPVHHAGGSASLEADQALIRQLAAQTRQAAGELVIAVKAWEPPLLEFIDFIRELRQQLEAGREILVVPVAVDQESAMVAPGSAQQEVWQRKIARESDPWLRVGELDSEVAR